jgi:UDP-N-acetylglucosamine 2-epimerase (non-hydrolysing)
VLGVPCLTLRENTERPITGALGTNHLVGPDQALILDVVERVLRDGAEPADIPLWDGKAGLRIAEVLLADLT